jgi:hypothetical protein
MEKVITVNDQMHFLLKPFLSSDGDILGYIISVKDCLQLFSSMLMV